MIRRKRTRPRRTVHPMTALLKQAQASESPSVEPKTTEATIAAQVVAWLETQGHDVYQEVTVYSGVADIVTLAPDGDVWIVEVKRGWSLDLLDQCRERRHEANRVFAAVPVSRTDYRTLFTELGIGTIAVTIGHDVRIRGNTLHRFDGAHVERTRSSLCAGHKTHAKAGVPSAAGRFTTFRGTAEALAAHVTANPGVSLKDAVASIQHHYSSPSGARANLAEQIRAGRIPGVSIREVDGVPFLYLDHA